MAQKPERSFLIVNPKGCMHVVNEDHARARLKLAGWRLATKEEQEAYKAANGNQRFDEPLAKPFDPEPKVEDALQDAAPIADKKARNAGKADTAEG